MLQNKWYFNLDIEKSVVITSYYEVFMYCAPENSS